MNSKLIKASLAGVAAIAVTTGGTTFAAWSDFGNVDGNTAGAGVLSLNLTSGSGGAAAPLAFGDLGPGESAQRAVYVASSDGDSVPAADLYATFQNVQGFENGCGSSNSEAVADPDCATEVGAADDGTKGELEKILSFRVQSYQAEDALTCQGYLGGTDSGPMINNVVLPNVLGNLGNPANHNTPLLISDVANPLEASDGICFVITSYWPLTHTAAQSPVLDNAAQGDSMSFDVKFDLIQDGTTP